MFTIILGLLSTSFETEGHLHMLDLFQNSCLGKLLVGHRSLCRNIHSIQATPRVCNCSRRVRLCPVTKSSAWIASFFMQASQVTDRIVFPHACEGMPISALLLVAKVSRL